MPKRIDHIAIIVRNIEQALAFFPLGGPGGSEIELVEPTNPDSSLAKFLDKRGEGLHHICLEVDNIDAALADMQAKDALVLDKQPRIAAEGRAIFLHPKGTNGVLLELVERDA